MQASWELVSILDEILKDTALRAAPVAVPANGPPRGRGGGALPLCWSTALCAALPHTQVTPSSISEQYGSRGWGGVLITPRLQLHQRCLWGISPDPSIVGPRLGSILPLMPNYFPNILTGSSLGRLGHCFPIGLMSLYRGLAGLCGSLADVCGSPGNYGSQFMSHCLSCFLHCPFQKLFFLRKNGMYKNYISWLSMSLLTLISSRCAYLVQNCGQYQTCHFALQWWLHCI